MDTEAFGKFAGLLLTAGMACGLLYVIWRNTETDQPIEQEIGFPPHRFPDQQISNTAALLRLSAIQARLLTMYTALPTQSAAAVWLLTFLRELRSLMDSAYNVAGLRRHYAVDGSLNQLVERIAQIEQEVAQHVLRLTLQGNTENMGGLESHIAALRLCAEQLEALH